MAAVDITFVNTQPILGGGTTYALSVNSTPSTGLFLQCLSFAGGAMGWRIVQLIGTNAWGISNVNGQSYANSFQVAANTPISLRIPTGGAQFYLVASSTTASITGLIVDGPSLSSPG